jgi:16S rRNA (cytidine1402-2'-O)-methyltransferase
MSVVAVPGPSAITAALSIAGLPTERFSFEGFLPARLAERRARISELAGEARTLVFFEAPHRIAESLEDLAAGFGISRRAAVARELTKVFETVYRGTLGELEKQARSDPNFTRGEITVVIEGAPRAAADAAPRAQLDATLNVLLSELAPSKAAALAARLTGAKRNDAYARALELSKGAKQP